MADYRTKRQSVYKCRYIHHNGDPVWPSGKALGWLAERLRFESALALLSRHHHFVVVIVIIIIICIFLNPHHSAPFLLVLGKGNTQEFLLNHFVRAEYCIILIVVLSQSLPNTNHIRAATYT